MKWIGQHIYDLISRFRSDVYLEDIDTGTIASGGNLGLDSNNKIVKAAEAAGDIEGVTAGTNLTGGGTSGTVTLNLADASTSAKGAASFASADFDVSSGAVSLKDECIVFDYLERNLIQTSSESFADDDTSIMTSAAIEDKIRALVPNLYGSIIKLLPTDFEANEDGGATKTMQFDDTGTTGLKPGNSATELLAFVSIPEGMKATHVDIYAAQNLTMECFELDVNASGLTSKGSGTTNTTLDITDVNSTATNYLMIIITTVATTNRIWGGVITIAAQ